MLDHLAQKTCYVIAVALVIAIEHKALASPWKRYEMSRWTLGIVTVMALSFPLVFLGGLDFSTWAWLMVGFGIAGAVTAGLYTNDKSKVNARARRHSKGKTQER